MPLIDYQLRVDALVRDEAAKIAATDRDHAIIDAAQKYAEDRPRAKVEDLAAATANLITLPASWVPEYSALVSIEYPIGEVPPAFLEAERYRLYQSAGAATPDKIMLLDAVNVGASLRVTYTVRHQLDTVNDTIPTQHREAVCCWAAALLLDQLASLYSGDRDSTISADSVDHGGRAAQYHRQAGGFRKRYFDALGIDPKRAAPAGAVVNLQFDDSRGQPRLTHPRRYR